MHLKHKIRLIGTYRYQKQQGLLTQALGLFKAAGLDIKNLMALARPHEDHSRMQAATFLFDPIHEAYQQQLRDTDTIDFDDMVGKAIDYLDCTYNLNPSSIPP
ncbi:MAG: hypothetical protein Q8K07_17135 [Methylicorpusculum sp.]|uniref:hypothetical protein n=1 Tax=Methylicorpusculum sp. TaxID=2713644 RepID=UPI002731C0AF|nr:hypothetical protein [Methylicorpusculum sp.]MDP2203747.1 hypothetical protein [Methylicorpusculum sp.]